MTTEAIIEEQPVVAPEVTCDWATAKKIYNTEINQVIALCGANMVSNDWTSLRDIDLTLTQNIHKTKFCCGESGGARQIDGYSVIVGAPDGSKPLAIAAFKKSQKSQNATQAVIHVWPGHIVAIAHHIRGVGCVLLYRVKSITAKPTSALASSYNNNMSVTRYVAELELNSVIDIVDRTMRVFKREIDITPDHPIVLAAIKKSTIFNCRQATYIRPFFGIEDGHKLWDMDAIECDPDFIISDPDAISMYFDEVISRFSESIETSISSDDCPHIGIKILENTSNGVVVKFETFNKSNADARVLLITKEVFDKHKDIFMQHSYESFRERFNSPDIHKRIIVGRYVGN